MIKIARSFFCPIIVVYGVLMHNMQSYRVLFARHLSKKIITDLRDIACTVINFFGNSNIYQNVGYFSRKVNMYNSIWIFILSYTVIQFITDVVFPTRTPAYELLKTRRIMSHKFIMQVPYDISVANLFFRVFKKYHNKPQGLSPLLSHATRQYTLYELVFVYKSYEWQKRHRQIGVQDIPYIISKNMALLRLGSSVTYPASPLLRLRRIMIIIIIIQNRVAVIQMEPRKRVVRIIYDFNTHIL